MNGLNYAQLRHLAQGLQRKTAAVLPQVCSWEALTLTHVIILLFRSCSLCGCSLRGRLLLNVFSCRALSLYPRTRSCLHSYATPNITPELCGYTMVSA